MNHQIKGVLIILLFVSVGASVLLAPNLVNSIQRGREKRTMADQRTLGTAIEAVAVDCGAYPMTSNGPMGQDCSSPGPLAQALVTGGYVKAPIVCDGWGNPMVYPDVRAIHGKRVPAAGLKSVNRDRCVQVFGKMWGDLYVINSRGSDGITDCGRARWNASAQHMEPGKPSGKCKSCGMHDVDNMECDLTFEGGSFINFPDGI